MYLETQAFRPASLYNCFKTTNGQAVNLAVTYHRFTRVSSPDTGLRYLGLVFAAARCSLACSETSCRSGEKRLAANWRRYPAF